MNLTGISVTGSIRFTQANDVLDIEVDLFKTGQTEFTPQFYTLLFFDLMNGNVTGKDDAGNGITTGISMKVYDVTDNEQVQTAVTKLDWYEGLNEYYVEATTTGSFTPANDVRLRRTDILYTSNAGTASREDVIVESLTLEKSNFASTDTNNNSGVLIQAANGVVNVKGIYKVTISK